MIQTLTTRRLHIRPIIFEDHIGLGKIANDNVLRYMPEMGDDFDAEQFVKSKIDYIGSSFMQHVIVEYCTGDLIGYIGISRECGEHDMENRIGFFIGEQYHRRGYCSEIIKSLIDKHLSRWIEPVFATVYEGNVGSEKVLTKCGFTKSAVNRDTKFGVLNVFKYER